MKEGTKIAIKIPVGIIFALIIVIGGSFFGLLYYKFFAPKFEDARRNVFENTRSYNQAKLQELAKYKLEYARAEGNDKLAIASAIRHRFADYNSNTLPYELEVFLKEIRGF